MRSLPLLLATLVTTTHGAEYILLGGFDNTCGLRFAGDSQPVYYTELNVREGCVGCRDLCTRAPEDSCHGYQCTGGGGTQCQLWKRTPQFGSPAAGAECWVRTQGVVQRVVAQDQLQLIREGGGDGAQRLAQGGVIGGPRGDSPLNGMYAGVRYQPPSPPPSPPSVPLREALQAFEYLGHGLCAEPPKGHSNTVRIGMGTRIRTCDACLEACYATRGECGGLQCIDVDRLEGLSKVANARDRLVGLTSADPFGDGSLCQLWSSVPIWGRKSEKVEGLTAQQMQAVSCYGRRGVSPSPPPPPPPPSFGCPASASCLGVHFPNCDPRADVCYRDVGMTPDFGARPMLPTDCARPADAAGLAGEYRVAGAEATVGHHGARTYFARVDAAAVAAVRPPASFLYYTEPASSFSPEYTRGWVLSPEHTAIDAGQGLLLGDSRHIPAPLKLVDDGTDPAAVVHTPIGNHRWQLRCSPDGPDDEPPQPVWVGLECLPCSAAAHAAADANAPLASEGVATLFGQPEARRVGCHSIELAWLAPPADRWGSGAAPPAWYRLTRSHRLGLTAQTADVAVDVRATASHEAGGTAAMADLLPDTLYEFRVAPRLPSGEYATAGPPAIIRTSTPGDYGGWPLGITRRVAPPMAANAVATSGGYAPPTHAAFDVCHDVQLLVPPAPDCSGDTMRILWLPPEAGSADAAVEGFATDSVAPAVAAADDPRWAECSACVADDAAPGRAPGGGDSASVVTVRGLRPLAAYYFRAELLIASPVVGGAQRAVRGDAFGPVLLGWGTELGPAAAPHVLASSSASFVLTPPVAPRSADSAACGFPSLEWQAEVRHVVVGGGVASWVAIGAHNSARGVIEIDDLRCSSGCEFRLRVLNVLGWEHAGAPTHARSPTLPPAAPGSARLELKLVSAPGNGDDDDVLSRFFEEDLARALDAAAPGNARGPHRPVVRVAEARARAKYLIFDVSPADTAETLREVLLQLARGGEHQEASSSSSSSSSSSYAAAARALRTGRVSSMIDLRAGLRIEAGGGGGGGGDQPLGAPGQWRQLLQSLVQAEGVLVDSSLATPAELEEHHQDTRAVLLLLPLLLLPLCATAVAMLRRRAIAKRGQADRAAMGAEVASLVDDTLRQGWHDGLAAVDEVAHRVPPLARVTAAARGCADAVGRMLSGSGGESAGDDGDDDARARARTRMARRREEALAAEEEEEARLAESRELAHSVRFAQAMAAAGHGGAHDDDEQWESVEPRGSGRSGSRLRRELTEEDEAEQLC